MENFLEFKQTLNEPEPPMDLSPSLKALWYDAKGDWSQAHEVAQGEETSDGAWVHAYLHRKEGDAGNARYWYTMAGREMSDSEISDEWQDIVEELLRNEN